MTDMRQGSRLGAGFSALVIDDDDFSRRTAVRLLRRLGAGNVAEAEGGRQAIALAAAHDGRLDLVVCDLRMPEVDGIETIRSLVRRHAGAAIILASGVDVRVLRAASGIGSSLGLRSLRSVAKPLTLQGLRTVFHEIEAEPEAVAAALPYDPCPPVFDRADVERGFAAGEFTAYVQPKAELRSGAVVGAEALVRWVHPQHGVLRPGAFLPIVLRSGLFDRLTELMLHQASGLCAGWRSAGLDYSVSVNLPVACLASNDLPDRLEAIVVERGLGLEHVILEVTEDGWLSGQPNGREVLTRLRLRGFGLSIDDFGTGFSTMQQLLHAPFSEMKIDRSFVMSAPHDPEAAVALRSSITLARDLGLAVVAEGVETDAHWRLLRDAGCDMAQGYLLSRPLTAESFLRWAIGRADLRAAVHEEDAASLIAVPD